MNTPFEELGFKPLIGTDEVSIDDKGRVLFSKKKRERLGQNFALVVGDVGCLEAYPNAVWQRRLADVFRHEGINHGRQQFTRLFLGFAEDDLGFDSQGRVVIPVEFRRMAKLVDRVLLIGCGDRVEIWSKAEWDAFNRDRDDYGRRRREDIARAYTEMVGYEAGHARPGHAGGGTQDASA